jgi:hypothetical protein
MLIALLFGLLAHAEDPQPAGFFGITLGAPKAEDEHVLTGAEIGKKFESRVSEQAEELSEDKAYKANATELQLSRPAP